MGWKPVTCTVALVLNLVYKHLHVSFYQFVGEIERALDLVRPKIVHTVPSICPSLQQIIPKIDSVKVSVSAQYR